MINPVLEVGQRSIEVEANAAVVETRLTLGSDLLSYPSSVLSNGKAEVKEHHRGIRYPSSKSHICGSRSVAWPNLVKVAAEEAWRKIHVLQSDDAISRSNICKGKLERLSRSGPHQNFGPAHWYSRHSAQ
jgi:hypothetical protein